MSNNLKKYGNIYEIMAEKKPETFIKLEHDGHTIITNWSRCVMTPMGRIDWQKSIDKQIDICRDGSVRLFKIVEYIKNPTPTAHDAKLRVVNIVTNEEFVVWSRDFKQGDIKKLFS